MEVFKNNILGWEEVFFFFCFLLLPAGNINIRAGASVAILNPQVTFKMRMVEQKAPTAP